jgi:hypothetical protein
MRVLRWNRYNPSVYLMDKIWRPIDRNGPERRSVSELLEDCTVRDTLASAALPMRRNLLYVGQPPTDLGHLQSYDRHPISVFA